MISSAAPVICQCVTQFADKNVLKSVWLAFTCSSRIVRYANISLLFVAHVVLWIGGTVYILLSGSVSISKENHLTGNFRTVEQSLEVNENHTLAQWTSYFCVEHCVLEGVCLPVELVASACFGYVNFCIDQTILRVARPDILTTKNRP